MGFVQRRLADEDGLAGVVQLKKASGIREKKKIIEEYQDNESFVLFLYLSLRPDFFKFGISQNDFKIEMSDAQQSICGSCFDDIFDCCEFLMRCRVIDDATIRQVVGFVRSQKNEELKTLYKDLLTGKLKLGVTGKTVNKIIPGLIPMKPERS